MEGIFALIYCPSGPNSNVQTPGPPINLVLGKHQIRASLCSEHISSECTLSHPGFESGTFRLGDVCPALPGWSEFPGQMCLSFVLKESQQCPTASKCSAQSFGFVFCEDILPRTVWRLSLKRPILKMPRSNHTQVFEDKFGIPDAVHLIRNFQ